MSHSIWNENPVTYSISKRIWSTTIYVIFPFAIYCVLRKSPKNFESLKWILLFHISCITIEWFSNSLLIDIYEFEPSPIIRIEGILRNSFDAKFLFRIYSCIEDVSSTSALILFCSRLLLIVNMYRKQKTVTRKTCEFLIYLTVTFFGLWSLPYTISGIPEDQVHVKMEIVRLQIEPFYPDCIMDPTSIVVSDPLSDVEDLMAYIELASWCSIAAAILLSARLAYGLLDRSIGHMLEATRRMHQKFNQRTVFQALIYLSFASIPFTLLYSSMLLKFHVPGLTYFIDFFSENYPTACAVTLFPFYDPYQNYLLQVLRLRKSSDVPFKNSIHDKTTTTVVRI